MSSTAVWKSWNSWNFPEGCWVTSHNPLCLVRTGKKRPAGLNLHNAKVRFWPLIHHSRSHKQPQLRRLSVTAAVCLSVLCLNRTEELPVYCCLSAAVYLLKNCLNYISWHFWMQVSCFNNPQRVNAPLVGSGAPVWLRWEVKVKIILNSDNGS